MKTKKFINKKSYRLVNSKFPPITLFDDVASADDFNALYELQALTNPRIKNEIGDLSLLNSSEIPFNAEGTNYVTAPFTHVNPDGSRFSDGSFGMLYLADTVETALAETLYHQEKYFQNIVGLHYDTIDMRCLEVKFDASVVIATELDETILDVNTNDIYIPDDYTVARIFGSKLKAKNAQGLEYNSVRNDGATCWGLFTPKFVKSAIQTQHFEFVYNGTKIANVRELKI